jgi:mannosyltransferase
MTSPDIVVFNIKRRLSGVTTTIINLLPVQAQQLKLGYVGPVIPGFAQAAASPSFVHLSLWQAVQAARAAKRAGRSVVWHVRRDHEQQIALLLRALFRLPVKIVFTSAATRQHGGFTLRLISKMDAVIATTPVAAQMIESARPKRLRVIPHGVNTRQFCPPANKESAWKEGGLPGRYGIGVFGRVRHQKGIHLYVQAMLELLPQYPEFTAIIVGLCKAEDEAYRADLVQKIAAAGLEKRIVFLGMVSNEEVLAWYQRVIITVACPLNEGFGLTPLEGMACESAVVASRTGAFEELVVEGETGHLIPTHDAQALTLALQPLLANPEKIVPLAQQGRTRVVQHYSIEAEAQRIGQVYQELRDEVY